MTEYQGIIGPDRTPRLVADDTGAWFFGNSERPVWSRRVDAEWLASQLRAERPAPLAEALR